MDESSGRGHREKIPSAKLKEQTVGAINVEKGVRRLHLPVYIAPRDPKFEQDQDEVKKTLDHVKTGPNGERYEFFSLGNHVETKEKRFYSRAKRDRQTFYFHAAEAPPLYARLSDEQHPQCQIDKLRNCFSRDMLSKTGEFGNYTTKANVFAREGQFFWEARIVSQAPPGKEPPKTSLASFQEADRSATNRGGLRVGFARREAAYGEPLGNSAYSYCVATRSGFGRNYGTVRFNSEIHHVDGEDFDDLQPGDVVGLMITLPSLEVHQRVVEGTFNPADYPDLECGPAQAKSRSKKGLKKTPKAKGKEKESEPVSKSKDDGGDTVRAALRSQLSSPSGFPPPPTDQEVVRDRNPFLLRGMTYFECPDYTPHPDLGRPNAPAKQKSQNPETNKPYVLTIDAHPTHELPHLRTLPGSKIEIWVNGKYHGILWKHLFAFLPPASYIEVNHKTSLKNGEVDDGLLGYYPAISHFTGGAVECKFNGPWWYGFQDGPAHSSARPIGERYNEQIVEDFVCDMMDELYLEKVHGDSNFMKKAVAQKESNGAS